MGGFCGVLEEEFTHGVVGHVFFPEGETRFEVFLQLITLGHDSVTPLFGINIEDFHRECVGLEDVFWGRQDVGLEIFPEGDDLVAGAVDFDVLEGGQAVKPEHQETCGKAGD